MPPSSPGSAPSRAPRRDALRNRAHLIETAARAFRDEGLEVGVDEIARRARVGIATLYRHFPTKGDLVIAVSSGLVERLGEARDRALDDREPRPLERFLRAAVGQLQDNRGLVEALAQHPPDPAIRQRMREQTLALLEPLVVRGHATGELRDDFDAEDLLVSLRMLGAAARAGVERDVDRYLQLMLRGLRR
jgi:AcrR family transcriptional regulator